MTDALPRAELSLFRRRARDLVRRPPVTCTPDTPVGQAVAAMASHDVGSVVVVDREGAPAGIVTLRDVRTRLVAAGRTPDVPVSSVMTTPLVTVAGDVFAFDAWLAMARRGIHHLGVLADGPAGDARLVGVLGGDDFSGFWLNDPLTLARDLDTSDSIDALAATSPRVTDLVRRLVADGASPGDVGAIVAEINDRLVRRVVALAERRLEAEGAGRPPVAYAWLAAGSEGRREQTLRTDQDSGLVYEDPAPDGAVEVERYFGRLARVVGDDLVRLGFARCPGGFMAENRRWCASRSLWADTIAGWLESPSAEACLEASVYLDLRPVAGDDRPAAALRDMIVREGPSHVLFQRYLARSAVERRPPLGLFGRLVVKRSGPQKGTIDVKARGVFPATQAMRVYAVALGLPAVNTLDRLAGARAAGAFTDAQAKDLSEAYAVVLRIRLAHQLARIEAGAPPDNDVDPRALGRIDRLLLKEAFRTLRWLLATVEDRFQTAEVG